VKKHYMHAVVDMEFQEMISGAIKAGTSFPRSWVNLDYVDAARRALIDARDPGNENFVNNPGQFHGGFKGKASLVAQARSQIAAAKRMAIEFHFAEQRTLDATRALFAGQLKPITGIKLVLH
jgi:hypothetical protein